MQNFGDVSFDFRIDVVQPQYYFPRPSRVFYGVANNHAYYSDGKQRYNEDHCIFHYTLTGSGVHLFKGKEYEIHPGEGFLHIINDPEAAYYYPLNGTDVWKFLVLVFEGDIRSVVRGMLDTYGPVYTLPQNSAFLGALYSYTADGCNTTVSCARGASFIYGMLSELADSVRFRTLMQYPPLVRDALLYIESGVALDINASDTAAYLNVSREYLSREFACYTGMLLKDYIKKTRLTEACRRLKADAAGIGVIAADMHFSSASNFARWFTLQAGVSPLEFRRNGIMPF